jgi:nucleotide-binding universal stress UspA family protein
MFKTVIAGVAGRAGDADAVALAELLAEPGGSVIPTRIQHGQPVGPGLRDAAVEHRADLIVVGSSSRGMLGRILAGDDVKATLRSAPCGVAIAPRGFAAGSRVIAQIGVGYDGSPQAQIAMDTAKVLAARDGARLHALGVAAPSVGIVSPIGVSAYAAIEARREQTRRYIAELAPQIVARAVDGIASQRLAELSSEVDLLIVGSSRRGAIGRVVLGSTSEALSREASCPLLVVTAPGPSRPSRERPGRPASAPAT